jgi:hypothetical protein
MTEVSDGTDILYSHIVELYKMDAIDVEEKRQLETEVEAIYEEIMTHYEHAAEVNR